MNRATALGIVEAAQPAAGRYGRYVPDGHPKTVTHDKVYRTTSKQQRAAQAGLLAAYFAREANAAGLFLGPSSRLRVERLPQMCSDPNP